MSLVLPLPRDMHLCRYYSNVPSRPSLWKLLQNPHVGLTFRQVQKPLRLPHKITIENQKVTRTCGGADVCTFPTSQHPKVVRARGAFRILTWKFASCHNGVHFLSISTGKNSFNMFIAKPSRHNAVHHLNISPSKSGSSMWCSHHFDMELRFPPHQLKLFPHLTCQGCSGREVCSFFDFKTCFPPQRRAIVHLLCGEMAPQPPF